MRSFSIFRVLCFSVRTLAYKIRLTKRYGASYHARPLTSNCFFLASLLLLEAPDVFLQCEESA